MSPDNLDRLKRVARYAVPSVLGAMAVKNIREISRTKHVSYWEASQSFIIDLLEDGKETSLRLSGQVLHGPGGRHDIADFKLEEKMIFEEYDISRFEEAFLPADSERINPLQNQTD